MRVMGPDHNVNTLPPTDEIMFSKIHDAFSRNKNETDSDVWWLPLDPETPLEPSLLGGKGVGLIRLMRAGFNVPAGVVLTTQFLHDFYFLEEPAIRRQLDAALNAQGRPNLLWAVRCSPADRICDKPAVADRMETFLNVPAADLFDCVKQCWAAVYADRDQVYRFDQKNGSGPFLAVILQQMAAVQCAGVLYTRHPDRPDRDAIVIKGVSGLNRKLQSGSCPQPDCLELDRNGQRPGAEAGGRKSCLDSVGDEVLARLACDLEQALGAPQVADWVFDGRILWVIESRPAAA